MRRHQVEIFILDKLPPGNESEKSFFEEMKKLGAERIKKLDEDQRIGRSLYQIVLNVPGPMRMKRLYCGHSEKSWTPQDSHSFETVYFFRIRNHIYLMKQIAKKENWEYWTKRKSEHENYSSIMETMIEHKTGISFYIFKIDQMDVIALEGFMNRSRDPKQVNKECVIPLIYHNMNEDNTLKDYLDKCVPQFRKHISTKEKVKHLNLINKKGYCKVCNNKKNIFKHYYSWYRHFKKNHLKEFKEITKQNVIPKSFYFHPID